MAAVHIPVALAMSRRRIAPPSVPGGIVVTAESRAIATTLPYPDRLHTEVSCAVPRLSRVEGAVSSPRRDRPLLILILQLSEQVIQRPWLHRHSLLDDLGALRRGDDLEIEIDLLLLSADRSLRAMHRSTACIRKLHI